MFEMPTPIRDHEVVEQLSVMGKRIQSCVAAVLASIPCEQPVRPQRLAKHLKINSNLTSRLLTALGHSNPLALIHALPGPTPLRTFFDAAEKQNVSAPVMQRARQAVDDFDGFLKEHFTERGELDTLLGYSLPEARIASEAAAKQAMFRGAVGITGVLVDTTLVSGFLYPSATNPERCDSSYIEGYIGLRRMHPGVVVEFATVRVNTELISSEPPDSPWQSFVGERRALTEFCQPQNIPLAAVRSEKSLHYRLTGNHFGRHAAVTAFSEVEMREVCPRRHSPNVPPLHGPSNIIGYPSRKLIFDNFFHQDVWSDLEPPRLYIYNTAVYGACLPTSPNFMSNQLDLIESITPLGTGLSCAHHTSVPRYIEMLEHVAASRGLKTDEFRGYRCEIAYPIYGSQVFMLSELPPG